MCPQANKYSIENQVGPIAAAARWIISIARTYADKGRSGVRISRTRRPLQQLIRDVLRELTDYACILI